MTIRKHGRGGDQRTTVEPDEQASETIQRTGSRETPLTDADRRDIIRGEE